MQLQQWPNKWRDEWNIVHETKPGAGAPATACGYLIFSAQGYSRDWTDDATSCISCLATLTR